MNGFGTELVYTEGSSNKFWRCFIVGNTVITHYGRIGSKGSTTVKHFSSTWDAKDYEYDITDSKYRKGYRTQQAKREFPIEGTLAERAASASPHTGNGGTDPDATWQVIRAWEIWMAYTQGRGAAEVEALLRNPDAPSEVRAIAVHHDRVSAEVLGEVAANPNEAQEVRAAAFFRLYD